MAPPTLESLPNEIIVQIAKIIRDGAALYDSRNIEDPEVRAEVSKGTATLASLCLTSRRFNAPVTGVLYEQVYGYKVERRSFFNTIITSRSHAAMVKSLEIELSGPFAPLSGERYNSVLQRRVKFIAKPLGIREALACRDGFEKLAMLSTLEKIQDLHLSLPGQSGWNPKRGPKESYDMALSNIHRHIAESLSTSKIKDITLSVRRSRQVEMSHVIPVLSAPCLETLKLINFGSWTYSLPEDLEKLEKEFSNAKLSQTLVRTLVLSDCNFGPDHVQLLTDFMPHLTRLEYKFSEDFEMKFSGPLSGKQRLSYQVNSLLHRCPKLESLSLGDLYVVEMTYNDEHLSRAAWNTLVAGFCDQADFSLFPVLKALDIPSSVIMGNLHSKPHGQSIDQRLPPRLESLAVYMLEPPFYTRAPDDYPLSISTKLVVQAEQVDALHALLDLLRCLKGIEANFEQLNAIQVVIPMDWPYLPLSEEELQEVTTLTSGCIEIRSMMGRVFMTYKEYEEYEESREQQKRNFWSIV